MRRKTKWLAAGAVALAVTAGGATAAMAGGTATTEDQPIAGEALAKASAAALAATKGGRVTETEVGDEESYYQVEVTLDDGSQVDVQLNEQFKVVGSQADSEHGGDTAETGTN